MKAFHCSVFVVCHGRGNVLLTKVGSFHFLMLILQCDVFREYSQNFVERFS